jgi:hypothetical protein
MAVADQREKNSFHSQAPPRGEEAKCDLREELTIKAKLITYLVPVAVFILRVGCQIEGRLREILASHRPREPPSFPRPTFTTLLSAVGRTMAVHFDSNSYPIRIDNHALCCMVNAPHHFEDLKLIDVGEVEGNKSGLDIKGTGTFKFKIKDNNGMTHKIIIPNGLHVSDLKRCLLSQQHWVQDAKDNYPRPKGTRMSQDDEFHYRHWGQAKCQKLIPYNPLTNVPIIYTATLLRAYRAFATTFEAMEAPFFQRERVLQFPGRGRTIDKREFVPEKFLAEENVNYQKNMLASEGANTEDRMVKTANLLLSPLQEKPSRVTRQGLLTFDPSPPTEVAGDVQLLAANKWPCSCNGITALVTLPSQSSNSSPSTARFQRSLPRCCLPSMLAAFSAQ